MFFRYQEKSKYGLNILIICKGMYCNLGIWDFGWKVTRFEGKSEKNG